MKVIYIILTIFLVSCGGSSGSGNSGGSVSNSSGTITKGPISGANCSIYRIVAGAKGSLLSNDPLTDNGNADFGNLNYTGNALIECTGGTYIDEATGNQTNAPDLKAVVSVNGNGSFTISPLTDLAYQLANDEGNLENAITTYNTSISDEFGLDDINITTTKPTNINTTNIADNNAGHYGTALAQFSQLIQDGSEGTNTTTIINSLKTKIKNNDYSFLTNLDTAMDNFLATGHTKDKANTEVKDKVKNKHGKRAYHPRSYPSIFQAWGDKLENKPDENEVTRIARHDMVFGMLPINVYFIDPNQSYAGLTTKITRVTELPPAFLGNRDLSLTPQEKRKQILQKNPNIVILGEVRYRDARCIKQENEGENWWEKSHYPLDHEYWLRNGNNELVIGYGTDVNDDDHLDHDNDSNLLCLIDFTNVELQNLIADKVLALKQSGLFDGVMLDWWNETIATSDDANTPDWDPILTKAVEQSARIAILQKIRAKVGNDFLIIGNTNDNESPLSKDYLNGGYMENYKSDRTQGYTLEQVQKMESSLLWNEANFQEPRINAFEAWRIVDDRDANRDGRVAERDLPKNKKWMRMMTTLVLTHSNAYILFGDDVDMPISDHKHNWYDFWDIDLSKPISATAQKYNNIDGLFIREFENGWAVYNRSGSNQIITFNQSVESSSGVSNTIHTVADFDGDIFIKEQ